MEREPRGYPLPRQRCPSLDLMLVCGPGRRGLKGKKIMTLVAKVESKNQPVRNRTVINEPQNKKSKKAFKILFCSRSLSETMIAY